MDKPLKIELQRADVVGRIERDRVLVGAEFIRLLGPSWRALVEQGRAKRAPDHAVVFQQGDGGDSISFVLSGAVNLFARRDADTVELGSVQAGSVFGCGDAGAPRWCSAVANGTCEFLEFERVALLTPSRPGLIELISRLHLERRKALDEMADFMNRW